VGVVDTPVQPYPFLRAAQSAQHLQADQWPRAKRGVRVFYVGSGRSVLVVGIFEPTQLSAQVFTARIYLDLNPAVGVQPHADGCLLGSGRESRVDEQGEERQLGYAQHPDIIISTARFVRAIKKSKGIGYEQTITS